MADTPAVVEDLAAQLMIPAEPQGLWDIIEALPALMSTQASQLAALHDWMEMEHFHDEVKADMEALAGVLGSASEIAGQLQRQFEARYDFWRR